MRLTIRHIAVMLLCGALACPVVEARGRNNSNDNSQRTQPARVESRSSNNKSKGTPVKATQQVSRPGNAGQTRPNHTSTTSVRPTTGTPQTAVKPANNQGRPGSVGNNQGNRPGNVGNNQGNRPGSVGNNQGNRPGSVGNNQGNRPGNVGNNQGNRPGNVGNNQGNRPGNGNKPGNNGGGHNPGPGHNPGHGNNFGPGHNPGPGGHGPGPAHGPGHGHGPGFNPHPGWAGLHYGEPYRPYMPPLRPYHRPVPPPAFRPIHGVGPVISTILGITLGTALDLTINNLLYRGIDVAGYGANEVYINNATQLNMLWPNATLFYTNGGLVGSEFVYSTPYYDLNRYNTAYMRLINAYGQPVSVTPVVGGGMTASWWGYNGQYVTLQFMPQTAINGSLRYFTTLSFGI